MNLSTGRLFLRHWEETDAEDLYQYASDPLIGPPCGWPVHSSVQESRDIIRDTLQREEAYAICLKPGLKVIGDIELKLKDRTDMTDRADECELGYWVGRPFWGQGLIPEAAQEILRHAFEDIGMNKVWVGYYEGNVKSRRVQEKLGFKLQWVTEDVNVPRMNEKRRGYVSCVSKDDWKIINQVR